MVAFSIGPRRTFNLVAFIMCMFEGASTRAHESTFAICVLYWSTSKQKEGRNYCRHVLWILLVRLWLCCLPDLALFWTAVWSISAAEWEKLAPCCALLVRGEGKRDRGRVLAWLLNGEFVIYDRATEISVQGEFILAHTHTLQARFLPCGSWVSYFVALASFFYRSVCLIVSGCKLMYVGL